MSEEMSNYLENAVLDHFFRGESVSAPATRYVSLFSNNPQEDASGTELTGNGYARQSASFGPPSNGTSSLNLELTFESTGAWSTVSHFAIFDALTAGNMLMYSPIDTPVSVTGTGQRIVFEVGSIDIMYG